MPELVVDTLGDALTLPPLPIHRPLLLIGHGTKDVAGRQTFIDFAKAYEALDPVRPVIPCFLELTTPTILEGVEQCVAAGFTDLSALPILLFAARHNKFDVTNELDRARGLYPQVTFNYGRHFGITPPILDLWRDRLAQLDSPEHNPHQISREDTVLLFVGRGSSDPDANGDVCKLARIVWEGSGYKTVEVCFIGITHPRLEEGFARARYYNPKRIIVLPYFMFTGVLVQKIFRIAEEQQAQDPAVEVTCLPEMGIHPQLLRVLRDREIETQTGQVNMNCELCKFRLAALNGAEPGHHHHDHGHDHGHAHGHDHSHDHHGHAHGHNHDHAHGHNHDHGAPDPYAEPQAYHDRIWQVP